MWFFTICWRIPLSTIILCLYFCVCFRSENWIQFCCSGYSILGWKTHYWCLLSLTLFQKKNEKDEKMQWACLSLIWSGGLIGTRSYYCDGWSEKRINKLLNSYFIMPYKLYWSPFFISFNSCLIFVNLGCYTTILSDNVWRWFVKLFFPFIFSVS